MSPAAPFGVRSTGEEAVFAEPWEARVFALVVSLYERGLFSWPEWAAALAARIRAAQAAGDPDLGDTCYRHWVGALEDLLADRGVNSVAETARWRIAWQHAARRVPHGNPIEVQSDDFDTGL